MAGLLDQPLRSLGVNPDDPSTDPFIRLLMTGSQYAPGQVDRGGLESAIYGNTQADNYDIPRHMIRWSDALGQGSQQRVSQLGSQYGRLLDALGAANLSDEDRASLIRQFMANPNMQAALGPIATPFVVSGLAPEEARQQGPMGSYDYVMNALAKSEQPLQRESYDLMTSMVADPLTYAGALGGVRNVALGGTRTAARGILPQAGKVIGELLNTGGDEAIQKLISQGVRESVKTRSWAPVKSVLSNPKTVNEILTEIPNILQSPAAYGPAVLVGRGIGQVLPIAGEKFVAPTIRAIAKATPQPVSETISKIASKPIGSVTRLFEQTAKSKAETQAEAFGDVMRDQIKSGDTLANISETVHRLAQSNTNLTPDSSLIISKLLDDARGNPNKTAADIGLTTGVNFNGGAIKSGDYALPWTDEAEYLADLETKLRSVPRGVLDVEGMRNANQKGAGAQLTAIQRVSGGTEVPPNLVSVGNLDVASRRIQLQPMEVVVDPATGLRQFKVPEYKGAWKEIWDKIPDATKNSLPFRPGDLIDAPIARRFMTEVVLQHEIEAYTDARLMGRQAADTLLSQPTPEPGVTQFEQTMLPSGTVEGRTAALTSQKLTNSWNKFEAAAKANPANPYTSQELFDQWLISPQAVREVDNKRNAAMAALSATNPPVGGKVDATLSLTSSTNGKVWTHEPVLRLQFDHNNVDRAKVALAGLATRGQFKDSKFFLGTRVPEIVVTPTQQTYGDVRLLMRMEVQGASGGALNANELAALRNALKTSGHTQWRLVQENAKTYVESLTGTSGQIPDPQALVNSSQDAINDVIINNGVGIPISPQYGFYRIGEVDAKAARGASGVYGVAPGAGEGAGGEASRRWLGATSDDINQLYDPQTGWRPIAESGDINANVDRAAIPTLGQPSGPLDRTQLPGIPRDAQPTFVDPGARQLFVDNMLEFDKAADDATKTIEQWGKLTTKTDGTTRTIEEALADPKTRDEATTFASRFGTKADFSNTTQVVDLLLNNMRDVYYAKIGARPIESGAQRAFDFTARFLREKMIQTIPFVVRNAVGGGLGSVIHGFNPYIGNNAITQFISATELSVLPTELRRESGVEGIARGKSATEQIPNWVRILGFGLYNAAGGMMAGGPVGATVGGALGAVAGAADPRFVDAIRRLTQFVERTLRASAWIDGMRTHMSEALPAFVDSLPVTQTVKDIVLNTDGVFGPTRLVGTLMQDGGLSFDEAMRYGNEWSKIRTEASKLGIAQSRHLNFNYMDRRVIDERLGYVLPFVVWPTRNLLFWAQHVAETPAIARTMGSLVATQERERQQAGLTSRFEGTGNFQTPVSKPLVNALYGQPGQLRFNVLSPIFTPLGQFRTGQYVDEKMPASGQALEAVKTMGVNPWPFLDWPLQIAGAYGTKEFQDMFPYSSLVRSLSAVAGAPIEPEPLPKYVFTGLRDLIVGKPVSVSGSALKDYNINKELINMSIENTGTPDSPEYTQAMTNPASTLYQAAARRATLVTLGSQIMRLQPLPFPAKFLGDQEAQVREQVLQQNKDVTAARAGMPVTTDLETGRAAPTRESKAAYSKMLKDNPLAIAYGRAGDSPQAQKLQNELDEYSTIGGDTGKEIYGLVGKIRSQTPAAYESLSPNIKRMYEQIGDAKRNYKDMHPLVSSYLTWYNTVSGSESPENVQGPEIPAPDVSITRFLNEHGMAASAGDVNPPVSEEATQRSALANRVRDELNSKNISTLKVSNMKYLSPAAVAWLSYKSRNPSSNMEAWARLYEAQQPK